MPVDRRKYADLAEERFKEESVHTATSVEQRNVEEICLRLFEKFDAISTDLEQLPVLNRGKTVNLLRRGLGDLAQGYQCLDASRPWLIYWILHSLELLGESLTSSEASNIVNFIGKCQAKEGGFGGGPCQIAHLAPTYAAVNALVIVGTEEAFNIINRSKLMSWMDKLRRDDGSFTMHIGGEVDIRGVYCALTIAKLTNIYHSDLFRNTDQWLLRCQTYEGGFGGVPGMEAHGGYTFCGFAALCLMNKERLCDIDNLLRWTANRQMRLEGGFQGRTNKLVDGCYSFWQGGVFPLIHSVLDSSSEYRLNHEWLFNVGALQEYLLICCQDHRGGLIDKPGKPRDFYHTCYTLSGLSVAQHYQFKAQSHSHVLGDPENHLVPTHPIFNITVDATMRALQHFSALPVPGSGDGSSVNGDTMESSVNGDD